VGIVTVKRSKKTLCTVEDQSTVLPYLAYKRGEIQIKTQTRRSASSPAWPPPAGWPARVPRWRGCSGACCPCPSPPEAASAGMRCWRTWVAAPAPGCTAGAAWWGSPGGSGDEEKPRNTQAEEPGTQGI